MKCEEVVSIGNLFYGIHRNENIQKIVGIQNFCPVRLAIERKITNFALSLCKL